MMLACLYHRIGEGSYSNPPEFMAEHLASIAKRFRTVMPGDPLRLFRREVCLTFDDATSDFYRYAFPLICQFKLKCLLAVPAGLIDSSEDYCTWEELKEMAGSGRVEIASHSMNHKNLLMPETDLEIEIVQSKTLLEKQLGIPIRTFVYPYGKFDRRVHARVLRHYEYAMRIGMGINTSWQNWNRLIYRIPCDHLSRIDEPFGIGQTVSSLWFYLLNSIRGR